MPSEATVLSEDWENFDFVTSAREDMAERKQEWRALDWTVAWIDTHPKWFPITDWSAPENCPGLDDIRILTDPVAPCRRTWRFTLIGGGQIRITEHWKESHDPDWMSVWNSKTTLTVTPHTDQGLQVHRGEINGTWSEMSAHAVLLRETARPIADRAAATIRALTACDENVDECTPPDRDRFYALLDGARGCGICRRPLRGEISKLVGVGPDCARAWSIPHSRAAASKRLALRAQLLGAGS